MQYFTGGLVGGQATKKIKRCVAVVVSIGCMVAAQNAGATSSRLKPKMRLNNYDAIAYYQQNSFGTNQRYTKNCEEIMTVTFHDEKDMERRRRMAWRRITEGGYRHDN